MSGGSDMQRRTGIVIGACAALALVGSAGTAAWSYSDDDGRPVGSWHEAPAATRTPVVDPKAGGGRPAAESPAPTSKAASPSATTVSPEPTKHKVLPESAALPVQGEQKVGELVQENLLIGDQAPVHTFHYAQASYVKLHFSRLAMMPGDYLTVSNPDGTESYRYDGNSTDEWAMSITGDTAEVEMHRAAGGDPAVTVDQVARGYTRTEQAKIPEAQLTAPDRTGREESVCGGNESTDAVCYKSADPVAYTRSRAIARLLINGTELCTGWRIGADNRMLTNNHCFATSAQAVKTEVWFNYQCSKCGGPEIVQPTKVWGAKVLATDHTYDYTLFTLGDFAAARKFGFLALDTARPVKGQELYIPQHPAGEPTRIAGSLGEKAGTCAVADNAYNGYAPGSDVAYYCDTEGGSSGSPVLSRKTNKVVALHHFGGCPNSGVRADLLYEKLKSLL
jgi:lysyl endopeptidase